MAIHQMRSDAPVSESWCRSMVRRMIGFEGRAPACTLLVFIDDATGKLGHLQLVESESFFSYAQAAAVYFNLYGKPVAFYSDKHSVFRVNQPSVGSEHDLSQFGALCTSWTLRSSAPIRRKPKAGSSARFRRSKSPAKGAAFARHLVVESRQCVFARIYPGLQSAFLCIPTQ